MLSGPIDAKVVKIEPTFGPAENGTQRILRIRYTVRGQGPYTIDVAQQGYDPRAFEELLRIEATKIAETLDIQV